jgi:predicted component of type VI protein secretion system
MLLSNDPRFQEEYKNFRDRVEKITDPVIKERASSLLSKILREIREIDFQHQNLFSPKEFSVNINESRKALIDLRQQLNTLLSDWDKFR